MDIVGHPDDCPSWEKLLAVGYSSTRSLIVSAKARACWTPGTELLLTSHTRADNDRQVVKVESYNSRTGELILDRDIQRPITIIDSPDYAIEVASLSRRVKFEVEEVELDPLLGKNPSQGGHFIIHNTNRPQHLEGIEITSFGQQGDLGRYPLHFHYCGDSEGSKVLKNVM